jgi:hypothetical protein
MITGTYREVGRASFKGHDRAGCPRCEGFSPLTETMYRGNAGIKKPCCIECEPEVLARKQRDVERVRQWRKDQPDIRELRKLEARLRVQRHEDKVLAYRKSYYIKNKARIAEYCKQYAKDHPEINRSSAAKRRKTLKERIVPWSELDEIELFYKNRPEGKVVDHIVPLKGKNVSGLHVLSNLQYLSFEENALKGHKFEM